MATWKPMSVFQETYLHGLARLSLVKSILTWPCTICSIYSHSRFPRFLETRKPVKTSENQKLNTHTTWPDFYDGPLVMVQPGSLQSLTSMRQPSFSLAGTLWSRGCTSPTSVCCDNFKEPRILIQFQSHLSWINKVFIKDKRKCSHFIYVDQVDDAWQTNTLPILKYDDHHNSSPQINCTVLFQHQYHPPPPSFIIVHISSIISQNSCIYLTMMDTTHRQYI